MVSRTSARDRILDALEQLLVTTGSPQFTLESVAQAAEVSKGGLLYHFPSKDALLLGLVDRLAQRAESQIAQAITQGTSVAEFYLQSPDTSDHDELQLYRTLIAALRTVDGQHSELRTAIIAIMRSWDQRLQAEVDDPVRAEIIRLVGDGIYFAALLQFPLPDPELHRKVIEQLTGEK
ncbi:TetR/AcrR family transcriptional regulator [Hoyosella rhizosphaerae]|uniref:TetR family transcriptional regulator n=1 Tax=Hoyosella rhizosphaerae TaxID=1755582 RepID=A0A916UEN2_9ACTN|nr:TetR/AcrR family transcriptional regulator [Hoyosella rhizosphaerae]MBN4927894.1 TetR/AcrR family transcriptional regulator [Hoyosella rhizosphaerae]GGC70801.1 TetR family transcriptional regulator [Hoyosella rhizosphaerae]